MIRSSYHTLFFRKVETHNHADFLCYIQKQKHGSEYRLYICELCGKLILHCTDNEEPTIKDIEVAIESDDPYYKIPWVHTTEMLSGCHNGPHGNSVVPHTNKACRMLWEHIYKELKEERETEESDRLLWDIAFMPGFGIFSNPFKE